MGAAMVWMMALDQSTVSRDHVGLRAGPSEFKAGERGREVIFARVEVRRVKVVFPAWMCSG
jgi:hypothetical protein